MIKYSTMANLLDLAKSPRHIEILVMAPQHTLIEETYKYNIWAPLATIGKTVELKLPIL